MADGCHVPHSLVLLHPRISLWHRSVWPSMVCRYFCTARAWWAIKQHALATFVWVAGGAVHRHINPPGDLAWRLGYAGLLLMLCKCQSGECKDTAVRMKGSLMKNDPI